MHDAPEDCHCTLLFKSQHSARHSSLVVHGSYPLTTQLNLLHSMEEHFQLTQWARRHKGCVWWDMHGRRSGLADRNSYALTAAVSVLSFSG